MELTNKKILKITSVCIMLLIPFMQVFSRYLVRYGVINNNDSINPAIILYVFVPILLFIYIKDLTKSKRKLDIYDYIFYILIITGIIATLFSIDKYISIFGKEYRHEGLLSILSYYLLFINWKYNGTKKEICSFIKLITLIAVLNSIYALMQIYTNFNFILRFSEDKSMAFGLCINPNFFGSLIVTVLCIIIGHFLMNKKVDIKECLLIILLFISLINSQSTGPFITLIILVIFISLFLHMKKCLILKNVLILSIILVFTYIPIYFINMKVNGRCEMCDINKTMENGGHGRLNIWKNSLGIVKNNFITGVGFDNFYLAYPNPKMDSSISFSITGDSVEKTPLKEISIVDNAHNVYLHTLTTTGILGLIPYLLLCLLTFLKGLKSNNKLMFILLSGLVAYSVQAFANISVIEVAPIYFIIIGLMLSIKDSLI